MYLYDTHVHSSEGSPCGYVSAAEQARAFKQRGYAGIILTDHLSKGYDPFPPNLSWPERVQYQLLGYENAKAEGHKIGLDVFFGWEFASAKDKSYDILTYGLGAEFLLAHPNILEYGVQEYSEAVRKHGGYLAQAHPFRWAKYNDTVPPHLLDGIEVFNSTDNEIKNTLAREFATTNNLPMQAGSDSHYTYEPSKPCGVLLQNPAKNIHDIISAIKNGAELMTF